MKNGKHSATEVHATYDLDECWELVEVAEKYNKQCALLENYCYIYNVMMVLKMARAGLLGDLVFSEAGYQHDVRNVRFGHDGSMLWRAKDMLTHNGNLYPTHAIGPVAQWFNISRGDKFDYLVSMSSRSSGMNVYAAEHFGPNHPSTKRKYTQGDMSCTMIKTANGATFTLYFDAQLPRPLDMIYRVQGTKGIYMGSTDQIYIEGKSPNYEQWEPAKNYLPEYEHPLWTALGDKAKPYGHWGSDYLMMYRLVEAFRRGELVDMDVYDTVTWSVISPLSEKSVANKSAPVDFPDFTRGKWKTNKPLGIIKA
jgi:predicted dehydrogenase